MCMYVNIFTNFSVILQYNINFIVISLSYAVYVPPLIFINHIVYLSKIWL